MSERIDIDLLRTLLRYEPETGKLFWLPRPPGLFTGNWNKTATQLCDWWNGRFADREAFTATGVENCRAGRIFGRSYYAHIIAWALHHGKWPEDDIDHEDGDRTNNRVANLRIAGHQANMQNKKVYKSSKTGVHGVVWQRRMQRWQAYITVNKLRRHLRTFTDKASAIAARRAAELEAGCFHINHGRSA